MHKWQFWEDGIYGISSIIGGILFILSSKLLLEVLYAGKDLSPQKKRGKRWLFIVFGIALILSGILSLVWHIDI